jgi:hypothetical protein
MKHWIVFAALFAYLPGFTQKIDTIHAGNGQLSLRYLPLGTQRYLVYIKREGQTRNIWLWERKTTREKWHDTDAIVIRQTWTTSDTGVNKREVFSVVDPLDFTPVYHVSRTNRRSDSMYTNTAEFMSADPVAAQSRSKKRLSAVATTLNWELDLETFPLLPLQEGHTYVINFVQPGSKTPPAWYNYTVTGSEKIPTIEGQLVDCLKLYIEYGNNRGNSTWWLSKKTHEILKMEEHFGPITRFKIKLAASE